MNTLNYVNVNDVAEPAHLLLMNSGTVLVADRGLIESPTRPYELRKFAWRRVWRDGIYHYEVVVARRGTMRVFDATGDECGFAVCGTCPARGRNTDYLTDAQLAALSEQSVGRYA